MFAPAMMSAPPQPTYSSQPYVPRRAAVQSAAPIQRKPLIRAQAPEEPKPARPPLLTLPSPEQLGVTVRPAEKTTERTALSGRMKELGVLGFHIESLPDGRSRFTCWIPGDRPGLTRRIEAVAATESEATQRGLQEAARMRP